MVVLHRGGIAADAGGAGMSAEIEGGSTAEHARSLTDRALRVLHANDGPLTEQLARVPGGFGLGQVPADRAPDRVARMICGYCSTGCSLDVHLRDGTAVNVTPTADHPVNLGMACPKGWEGLTPMEAPDRATTPLLRGTDGRMHVVDWATAAATFAERMKAIQRQHGPDSVAFVSTGQIPSEEMALLGTVAKFGMGFRHGDGNTRQCMATAVVAYKQAFGFDAPPYTYADFEESDVVVLVGSNLAVAHPIMWERLHRNPHDPTLVVVDPRRTVTAEAATEHVAVRPTGDLALLYGIGHLLLELDAIDRSFVDAHTTGFDEYAEHVAAYTPARVTAETGIDEDQLRRVAAAIAAGRRVSFWWTMGVNQSHHGVRTAQAIIALALMTGNIGRPGTGANSITGQCNAMGSRLFSNTTSLLGGHPWGDEAAAARVADVLGIDPAVIPTDGGWAYDQIVDGIVRGTVRGLWVIATNGAHSWIGQRQFRELLDRLDFLVVQDLYADTETAQHADLVLPAAGWAEKEGTFINSERRLGLVQRVRPAPGQALADFQVFRVLAEAWGCGDVAERWTSPEEAFGLLRELTRGQPCDLTGVRDYVHVDERGGIQWPWSEADAADGAEPDRERRLFADGRFPTPDGRARFIVEDPRPPAEPTRPSRPLVLLTGRGSTSDWHTRTRTARSATLQSLTPDELWLEINPVDAQRAGVREGGECEVGSERGSIRARALPTATVPEGCVFLPMHDERTNVLTKPSFDPYSRQPAYKHAAVSVRSLEHWE